MVDAIIIPGDSYEQKRDQMVRVVTDALTSEHSKRNYAAALIDFLNWHEDQGRPGFTKAVVNRYKDDLAQRGWAASTINVYLAAVRKLAREAVDNGWMPQQIANGIANVKGVKQEGVRLGNWLSREEAQALINAPDVSTLLGLRDRAILAVLLGTALRREECAGLDAEIIQRREGRWVISDLVGKRGKIRTVPMPFWTKRAVDDWTDAANISKGALWWSMRKGDNLGTAGITSQAVWLVVERYAVRLGLTVSPHDIRRTAAHLMEDAGAPLKQISLVLGHASLDVTKRYLGGELNLKDAATDYIDIEL